MSRPAQMLWEEIERDWSSLNNEGEKLTWMMKWSPFKFIFKHFCKLYLSENPTL